MDRIVVSRSLPVALRRGGGCLARRPGGGQLAQLVVDQGEGASQQRQVFFLTKQLQTNWQLDKVGLDAINYSNLQHFLNQGMVVRTVVSGYADLRSRQYRIRGRRSIGPQEYAILVLCC